MSQTTLSTAIAMSPKSWYRLAGQSPEFVYDPAQAAAIEVLDARWHELVNFKLKREQFLGRTLRNPEVPNGLYLWGGVGRGKTFLMDAFYNGLPFKRKRRIHFHNFMAEVHHEMKKLAHKNDPLIALADNIAKSTRLLCLDEFHVDDIADAMILGRLVAAILERGVLLMTTSNYPPDGLYPNGLQRQNFLPAIELLKRRLNVLNVDGGNDHRKQAAADEPLFIVSNKADAETRMSLLFNRLAAGAQENAQSVEIQGRRLPVKEVASSIVWLDFDELCGGAHAQEDYLAIAHRYPTVFLSHIPQLTADHSAESKRFTWLIDVLYDNHVRLIASSDAPPEALTSVASGEFARTTSRLTEMQSARYLELHHNAQNIEL